MLRKDFELIALFLRGGREFLSGGSLEGIIGKEARAETPMLMTRDMDILDFWQDVKRLERHTI